MKTLHIIRDECGVKEGYPSITLQDSDVVIGAEVQYTYGYPVDGRPLKSRILLAIVLSEGTE